MARKNWHPADVIAALWKRGTNLRKVALANNFAVPTMSTALRQPCSGAERAIADALGLDPRDIWPERFDARGRRLHGGSLSVKVSVAQARLEAARKEAKKAS